MTMRHALLTVSMFSALMLVHKGRGQCIVAGVGSEISTRPHLRELKPSGAVRNASHFQADVGVSSLIPDLGLFACGNGS